jgi:heme/copper-type cytochrome/quinol oxidase subunit 2
MFASFKKFDIHLKAVDGVNQQTILGAVLTIISTILVLVLIFSEISYFMKIDVVSRMLTDKTVGVEAVKLEFDMQFYDVACNRLNFIQEVTRGTVHIHEPSVVEKFAVDDGVTLGCHVRGGIVIDKVGGNFRFAIAPGSDDRSPGMSSNFSHIVRHIAFTPTTGLSAAERMPELMENLKNQETVVPEGTGLYHYAIQVSFGHIRVFNRGNLH